MNAPAAEAIMCLALAGCASPRQLSTEMPAPPIASQETELALVAVLRESFAPANGSITFRRDPGPAEVKRYLAAGFALTDIYCDRFFRQTNAAFWRRRFGRTLTNDLGAAIGTVLGVVASVPKGVLTGASTVTGPADSTWRGFDDAFVVAPELQKRARAGARRAGRASPRHLCARRDADRLYDMTARSVVVRYAGLCTFLRMQSLLTRSIDQQRQQLQASAASPAPQATATPAGAMAAPPPPQALAPALPPIAPLPLPAPAARAGTIPIG